MRRPRRGTRPTGDALSAAYRRRAPRWATRKGGAMDLGLAGRTALVTGGSKGIGLETARALAREGVKVLICARRPDALAQAARDIEQTTQATIETHPLDVTRLDEIETIPRV